MIRIFKQFYLQRRIVYGSKIEGVFPDDSGKGGVTGGDSMRIADETSLLITDIVVELEDGSIANVEMQKIGYLFPGQRCACYSADLLLRQYKRVRGEKKKKFSYRDIKNVYTVVLFEKSPKEFHKYPEKYCHFFEQMSDTGLKLELLQKYVLIPLDRNTVQYMMDEQQERIDAQREGISAQQDKLSKQQDMIDDLYKGTINILRGLNLSDQEIIQKLCAQYQINETEARKYLQVTVHPGALHLLQSP